MLLYVIFSFQEYDNILKIVPQINFKQVHLNTAGIAIPLQQYLLRHHFMCTHVLRHHFLCVKIDDMFTDVMTHHTNHHTLRNHRLYRLSLL